MPYISFNRGYISLIGESIEHVANNMLQKIQGDLHIHVQKEIPFHITIFSKHEVQKLKKDKVVIDVILKEQGGDDPKNNKQHFIPLGLGKNHNVFYVVIAYPYGAQLRKLYNFPAKDFHITLSSNDAHDIPKDVTTLQQDYICELSEKDVDSILSCQTYATDPCMVRHIYNRYPCEKVFHRLSTLTPFENDFITETLKAYPSWSAPYLRYGENAMKDKNYKVAMTALLIAWYNAIKMNQKDYIMNRLIKCSAQTEWGPVFFDEIDESALQDPMMNFLVDRYLASCPFPRLPLPDNYVPQLSAESRIRCGILNSEREHVKLPRFFRWIIPFSLAAMSTPRNQSDVEVLSKPPFNIECVVTLTEESPLPQDWFTKRGNGNAIQNVFLSVPNYKAPTIPQVQRFIDIVCDQRKRTLIHCGGGKGRAGTFLACYIATCGFSLERQQEPRFSANEAIDIIRKMRPGSIETKEQEAFIRHYVSLLWKNGSFNERVDLIQEPKGNAFDVEGTFDAKCPIIMLCGLQGSGKSTFAEQLSSHLNYTIVSQDILGSPNAVLVRLLDLYTKKQKVIIDKCNVDVKSRKYLLDYLMNPKDVMCIHFDYPVDLCIQRADSRLEHPTIKAGRSSLPIKGMAKIFQKPKLSEGFKGVITVKSIDGCNALLRKFGVIATQNGGVQNDVPQQQSNETSKEIFHKFPRTRHLHNLGAASRDDLLLSKAEVDSFFNLKNGEKVIVQEKIDGANLGISIDKDTLTFKIQNRSHYVNAKYHTQFKPLDTFIHQNHDDLWKILTLDGSCPPGKLILFGEWMVAKHSIHYDRLPGIFVAFDVYDTSEDIFYSTTRMKDILKDTKIPSVPIIREFAHGTNVKKEDILAMVKNQSAFYDGVLEGVVIRKENATVLLDRAKIVRKDFICGNDHWSKGIITYNKVQINEHEDYVDSPQIN